MRDRQAPDGDPAEPCPLCAGPLWLEQYPSGIACLFAPDGSLVLSLPADPQRVSIGFSDPVQWY